MKTSRPLLLASLALNLGLAGWLALRRPDQPDLGPDFHPSNSPDRQSAPAARPLTASQITALRSADPAQMKAAGIPEDVAHILAAARAYRRMAALDRTKRSQVPDPRYWRSTPTITEATTAEQAEEEKIHAEFETAMKLAFPEVADDDSNASRYSYLSPSTREKISRIEHDYDELTARLTPAEGPLLVSDHAKLSLLNAERRRDFLAALTPEERDAYFLHDSTAAHQVRSRYGDAIQTESDYREVVALQQAFEERYPRDDVPGFDRAEHQLVSDIVNVIGVENFNTAARAHDSDYLQLSALTTRLSLPPATPDLVYALRDEYAQRSQALSNSALTVEERRLQFAELATKARAELELKLGHEGAQTYALHSLWLKRLATATPFSVDPHDAPTSGDGSTVYSSRRPLR